MRGRCGEEGEEKEEFGHGDGALEETELCRFAENKDFLWENPNAG